MRSSEKQDWNLEAVELPNVAPAAPSNERQDWIFGMLLDDSCAQQQKARLEFRGANCELITTALTDFE